MFGSKILVDSLPKSNLRNLRTQLIFYQAYSFMPDSEQSISLITYQRTD